MSSLHGDQQPTEIGFCKWFPTIDQLQLYCLGLALSDLSTNRFTCNQFSVCGAVNHTPDKNVMQMKKMESSHYCYIDDLVFFFALICFHFLKKLSWPIIITAVIYQNLECFICTVFFFFFFRTESRESNHIFAASVSVCESKDTKERKVQRI